MIELSIKIMYDYISFIERMYCKKWVQNQFLKELFPAYHALL